MVFQVLLAILKYNESVLLETQDETEAMHILTEFMTKVGEKPNKQDSSETEHLRRVCKTMYKNYMYVCSVIMS